jgi:hypothetical protein
MEATGIDCDELHHMIYGEYLPWYYKGTNMMPTYMSRYMCVYKEQDIDYAQLLKGAAENDKYYVHIASCKKSPVAVTKAINNTYTTSPASLVY